MKNESSPKDTRSVWQNQKPEGVPMSTQEIHQKAEKFERKVFWENALQYVLLLVGVAFVGFCLTWHRFPSTVLVRFGLGMTVAALLYMLWQIHKRSPFRRAPAELGIASCLDSYRKELEHRRDLHRSVWGWCFGPTIPGVAILLMGGMARIQSSRAGNRAWILVGAAICVALIYILGWMQSADRARKLQGEIDELDVLGQPR